MWAVLMVFFLLRGDGGKWNHRPTSVNQMGSDPSETPAAAPSTMIAVGKAPLQGSRNTYVCSLFVIVR